MGFNLKDNGGEEMVDVDSPMYDYSSIRIDADRKNFFVVSSINYPFQQEGTMIPYGIGDPSKAHLTRGWARGKFDGSFDMELHMHDWIKFKSYYQDMPDGVMTKNGIMFNVSFYDENHKNRIMHVLNVIITGQEYTNMNDDSGKPIMAKIKGKLTKEPDEYIDRVLVATRNFGRAIGVV
ncbi:MULTISPECIES: hypothetical protein [unclassified Borrelia]|uniref:hypothetical protein n=1 Tax=unclassified Borrelia TaxID=2649934 RepID=UPI001E55477D|nr:MULTISPECIES: hypothetical protein [unclassified Borrelia]UGQ16684.1 hypothetical protein LSO06_05035 [Borrelia sp. RT5S]UGQ17842.1 hypothetical protein LSO05_05270 [Borrelia sp. RT1S]